jgi:hypothetical protein
MMKNAGMAGAVALVGVGLITIGLGNFVKAPQAMAASSAALVEDGPEEPTIVWFDVVQEGYARVAAYRLWNDGTLERRTVGYSGQFADCELLTQGDCDWQEIDSPPGGDGYVCQADINGDRNVDGADLGLLLGYWGENPICADPAYPCFDLGNLGGPVAFK